MKKITYITALEQGSIASSGNQSSDDKVRASGYIPHFQALTLTVSATSATGKNILIDVLGYKNESDIAPVFDRYWYESPYSIDMKNYPNVKFFRAVFKYSDGSKLSPEEIASVAFTEEFDWYVNKDSEIKCENMPYAPQKPVISPYPSTLWRVSEDVLTHEAYPKAPEKAVAKPYPKVLWRIDYLSPNMPYHELFPVEKPAGAFMNAKNLEYARIPETVRKIGRWAFAETSLSKVRISPECEFYETSFPKNCLIEFYGSVSDEHSEQLYDSDGNTLIDADGARIYT